MENDLRTPAGRVVYTDVGEGPPIVFLHGNPTSAHLYRHLIDALAPEYRCIAPDYLGFGRSEAPSSFSYRPAAHARVIEHLLTQLGLDNLTLVLHDWGGPIGLSYAVRHPEAVERLMLMNTWAWPLHDRPLIRLFSGLSGTALGRMAMTRWNAFPRVVMPLTAGSCPPECCPQWVTPYRRALDTYERGHACWTFARSLLRETPWLRALWSRRLRLRGTPTLLYWGMADPAFGRESTLQRWLSLIPNAIVQRDHNSGHYVPEETGRALVAPTRQFLDGTAD